MGDVEPPSTHEFRMTFRTFNIITFDTFLIVSDAIFFVAIYPAII